MNNELRTSFRFACHLANTAQRRYEGLKSKTDKEVISLMEIDIIGHTKLMTYKVVEQEEKIQQLRLELNNMYQRWIRCSNFIESASSHTNDWDDVCDCSMFNGEHDKDCMSIKFRIDENYALTGKRFEDDN